jgi:hypothetical protein
MRRDGTVRASTSRTIQGQGALKALAHVDLFPGVVADATDYIRGWTDSVLLPTEFLALEGQHLAVLNGQDTEAKASVLYSPQFAVGGAWWSTLSVVNLDSKPGSVTLRFLGDDGNQIAGLAMLNGTAGFHDLSADLVSRHAGKRCER